MKHLKYFEGIKITDNIKCNWCGWSGTEDELYDIYTDECPNCSKEGFLMNIDPPGKDFIEYMKNNEPLEGIDIDDYVDINDYYRDAYPEYFSSKKYNL